MEMESAEAGPTTAKQIRHKKVGGKQKDGQIAGQQQQEEEGEEEGLALGNPPGQNPQSLFKEKVVVCRETIAHTQSDCFINFCAPNILTGTAYFARIHELAGPEMATACEKFLGACPTSSRVTSAFAAKNFKFIVHSIVPIPLDLTKIVDIKKVYTCIRNSLDLAIEEGAQTITFPSYFPGLGTRVGPELILRIFTVWIHRNQYSDQLREMKIICHEEHEFHSFVHAARSLYEEVNLIGHRFVPAYAHLRRAFCHRYNRPPRRYRRLYEPPPEDAPQVKLELSAKLAPTILVIDDEHGMKRQYRLTNKSRDGRKLYFRCSRCDTLIKKDGVQVRAKLIVEDGEIVSERYPKHHPHCMGKPLEKVLIQQVDRTSRREVKDGYLMPQDAYRKALDRMKFEARQLGIPVEECFPEWPKLRQQYCRIRKQAVRQRQEERLGWLMMNRGEDIGGDERMMAMGMEMMDKDDLLAAEDYYNYQQIFGQPRKRGRPRKYPLPQQPIFANQPSSSSSSRVTRSSKMRFSTPTGAANAIAPAAGYIGDHGQQGVISSSAYNDGAGGDDMLFYEGMKQIPLEDEEVVEVETSGCAIGQQPVEAQKDVSRYARPLGPQMNAHFQRQREQQPDDDVIINVDDEDEEEDPLMDVSIDGVVGRDGQMIQQ